MQSLGGFFVFPNFTMMSTNTIKMAAKMRTMFLGHAKNEPLVVTGIGTGV
jgi:hypothetical protein